MILMVAGSVAPRVSAVPPTFTFPEERPTETERSVRLEWAGGAPPKIVEVSTSVPEAKVRLVGQNDIQKLVLTLPAGSGAVAGFPSVSVKTDDANLPEFAVPIMFQSSARVGARGTEAGSPASPARGARGAEIQTVRTAAKTEPG